MGVRGRVGVRLWVRSNRAGSCRRVGVLGCYGAVVRRGDRPCPGRQWRCAALLVRLHRRCVRVAGRLRPEIASEFVFAWLWLPAAASLSCSTRPVA